MGKANEIYLIQSLLIHGVTNQSAKSVIRALTQ